MAKFDGDSYVTKIDTESLISGGITFLVREAAPTCCLRGRLVWESAVAL